MLTEKQISEWAEKEYKYGYSNEEESAAISGATWANEQNKAELAEKEAQIERLKFAAERKNGIFLTLYPNGQWHYELWEDGKFAGSNEFSYSTATAALLAASEHAKNFEILQ